MKKGVNWRVVFWVVAGAVVLYIVYLVVKEMRAGIKSVSDAISKVVGDIKGTFTGIFSRNPPVPAVVNPGYANPSQTITLWDGSVITPTNYGLGTSYILPNGSSDQPIY